MEMNEVFDVTIIGGGSAGLFASFYSGLREMKTKIIEYQDQLGGKVHVYPEKMIWDIGGLPPISGEQLIHQMTEQALTFDPEVVLGEKVTNITKNEEGVFVLETESGQKHLSKTVIVAIGGGIINPQKLEIEGAQKYCQSNLSYTIKSLQRFKNKTVLISGGGHTAVDWANELEPIAKQVYLTYRKGELNGHEADVSRLLNSSVECYCHTEIAELLPDPSGNSIEKVKLINNRTGETTVLTVDEVVVNHGYVRDRALLDNSDLNVDTAGYFIKGNAYCETSVPGLFAAGDVIDYEGKVHLIAGAFQDAINAVNNAKRFIEPEADEKGTVSSHNEIFYERNRRIIHQQIREHAVSGK